MYVCMYECMCVYACVCVYVCICMYVYMCTYPPCFPAFDHHIGVTCASDMYTYIHTYMYTFIPHIKREQQNSQTHRYTHTHTHLQCLKHSGCFPRLFLEFHHNIGVTCASKIHGR
jgi:hypothetical protein